MKDGCPEVFSEGNEAALDKLKIENLEALVSVKPTVLDSKEYADKTRTKKEKKLERITAGKPNYINFDQ